MKSIRRQTKAQILDALAERSAELEIATALLEKAQRENASLRGAPAIDPEAEPPSAHVIAKNGKWYCQCCAVPVPFNHICSCEGGPEDDEGEDYDNECPLCDGDDEECGLCEGTGFAGRLA